MSEIITFGEAMIRLAPSNFKRIEQTDNLNITPGGSEYNVACDISRLGVSTSWVSLLSNNPMGYFLRNKAREQGVDTSNVIFTDDGRTGLYFVEYGSSPRASKVYYDRANSSISLLNKKPDWDNIFTESKWFHTSGITPSLSENCAKEVKIAIEKAKKNNNFVSYDLNYRAKLWDSKTAYSVTKEYVDKIDFCIGNEEDFQKVLGVSLGKEKNNYEKIDVDYYTSLAGRVHKEFGFKYIGISLRDSVSVLRNNWKVLLYTKGKSFVSKEYALELVDRVGGGDSCSAGLIYSIYKGMSGQEAVDFAAAFSALKHSIWGDINLVTLEETEKLMKTSGTRIER
jgi:2-dehydro-3-deoxygluconokinase